MRFRTIKATGRKIMSLNSPDESALDAVEALATMGEIKCSEPDTVSAARKLRDALTAFRERLVEDEKAPAEEEPRPLLDKAEAAKDAKEGKAAKSKSA